MCLPRYQQFKDFQKRILVATNLFGRGMDIERVIMLRYIQVWHNEFAIIYELEVKATSKGDFVCPDVRRTLSGSALQI